MGGLSAAAMYASSFLGSYLQPDSPGENGTIGRELEVTASALYLLSQKRINKAFSYVPKENDQMRRDTTRTQLWFKLRPNYRIHAAGIANGVMKTASDQLIRVYYGLTKYMSPPLQSSAELTLRAAARGMAIHLGMARSVEYERLRKIRDDGLSMLFRHIELAAGVRGVADSLGRAAVMDMSSAASETLSKKTYDLNMQRVQWDKDQQMRAISDQADSAMGTAIGAFAGGIVKGYKA